MLKGHVFDEQQFTSECFALFIDTFLNKTSGVVQGCQLSNSSGTVTIGSGFFCVKGRFLQVQGENTLTVGTDNAYCILVCEIDLSKENTESELSQAQFKIVKGTSGYPSLTQQDITNGGIIYQFEFARFRTGSNGILDFTDTRAPLSYSSIFQKISNDTDNLVEDYRTRIANVEDGSAFMLSNKIIVGSQIPTANDLNEGQIYLQYFNE